MDLSDPQYYLNRELGTLDFQHRVLNEGLDERNPLLARVKALFYFTKNTDEFFMKRIGMLKEEMEAGITKRTIDNRTPREQWDEAMARFRQDLDRQYRVWQEEIEPGLAKHNIRVADLDEIGDADRQRLRQHFETAILPTLTPLAFDPAHPFPFISNLSLSIAVHVRPAGSDDVPVFTRIKVPAREAPYLAVRESQEEWVGVPLPELIIANLDLLLPDSELSDISLFRITRSAEVDYDEDVAEDLIDAIQGILEKRRRGPAVRLEVDHRMPESMRSLLLEELDLDQEELIEHPGLVNFLGFDQLAEIDRPDLKFPAWTPQQHPWQRGIDAEEPSGIFEQIKNRSLLVHHPYHSFALTTLNFLDQAADDPHVIGIKISIYRTDNDSKVLDALMRAARNGKQVAVLVELKARFDERHNVRWASLLESQGIHVAYGKQDHKTHTKLALVIRKESDGVRLYSHVGTGNYHSGTAKGYTDLGLLTADEEIGRDVVNVFNIFTGPHRSAPFRQLLIAPQRMRESFLEKIAHEAELARNGQPARIVAKMNALEHPEIVEALYRAGRSGVEIDLIIRDICRLRPQLDELSESIRVHSIVGRFLEHSRIFHFGNADAEPLWYIGSADWMKRNLDKRVEAVAPIRSPVLQAELRVILETSLADNRRRWRMNSEGSYTQCKPGDGMPELDSQQILCERAEAGLFGEHGPYEAEILKRQPGPRPRISEE